MATHRRDRRLGPEQIERGERVILRISKRVPGNDRERHGRPRHVGVRDVHDAPVEGRLDVCPDRSAVSPPWTRRIESRTRPRPRNRSSRPTTRTNKIVHAGGRRRERLRQRSRVQGPDVDDARNPLHGHGDRFAVVVGGGFPARRQPRRRRRLRRVRLRHLHAVRSASVTVNASVDPATPPDRPGRMPTRRRRRRRRANLHANRPPAGFRCPS